MGTTELIAQTLRTVFELTGSAVIEIRIPGYAAGYFDREHIDIAARQIAEIDATVRPRAIYMGLNPPASYLLERAPNQLVESLTECARDNDIIRLRLFLVDADSTRPSKTNSTDDEKAAARDCLIRCYTCLREQGWPAALVAD
jgi:hypothetical protein